MALTFEASQAEFEEIQIPPTEEAWLEARKPWWNASLAACLFDEHPYVTMGDACTEKLRSDFKIVDEDTAKLYARGIAMEPYIAFRAAEDWGWDLGRPAFLPRRGAMLCTPDYVFMDKRPEGVEVKSTRQYVRGVIPRYWWWQGQAQMWCSDWERVHFAVLDASLEVQVLTIDRDDDAIHRMMERAEAAIECLSWGEMPPGVELSAENVTALWPKDSGETAELGADMLPSLQEYLDARANEKAWKEVKERARDRCVQELGPDSVARIDNTDVFTYKASKDRLVVDWDAVRAEAPDLVEKHTTTKAGPRTFLVKDRGVAALSGGNRDEDW